MNSISAPGDLDFVENAVYYQLKPVLWYQRKIVNINPYDHHPSTDAATSINYEALVMNLANIKFLMDQNKKLRNK